MDYEVLGDTLPVVVCKLNQNESVFTQRGGMGWMTHNFKMKTSIRGGILKGITRKFMKESFFLTTYTCTHDKGTIAFPSNFPGSILAFDLENDESIIAQKDAFLCAESSTHLNLYFHSKPLVGFFGGEGFIMQKITGAGKVFLEVDGSSIKHTLEEGETMRVDPGHIAAISPSINFRMKVVKGLMNILFSGEGFLMTELEGPGDVWLQTMPIRNVAKNISPYLKFPKTKIKENSKDYDVEEHT